ncbi:MAG: hypothetical protein QOJ41_2311 [Acidobacteriaceae bacterium]|nr:hypothetical protein [Acidobacteriaceae bacterium]
MKPSTSFRKYEKHIYWWESRRDKGVYDAVNNGFSRSTGDITGWLNASDLLHTNGLFVVGSVCASLRAVDWLTGGPTRLYSVDALIGAYRFHSDAISARHRAL